MSTGTPEEPETPDTASEVDAPSDAPGSVEAETAAEVKATRGASSEGPSTSGAADDAAASAPEELVADETAEEPVADDETTTPPAGDELADVVAETASAEADDEADVEEEPDAEEAEKPRRARRPRRRRGAGTEAATEAPVAPAPSRRRARRDPNLPAPVVRAQAKYVRSSARKARLVCDHIRGKSVEEARAILALTPRAIASDWSKLLESAIANAEHNHELVGEDLYIKAVHADEGPTIKRFRPRAMGRATQIRKRTSHLTILLTPKDSSASHR